MAKSCSAPDPASGQGLPRPRHVITFRDGQVIRSPDLLHGLYEGQADCWYGSHPWSGCRGPRPPWNVHVARPARRTAASPTHPGLGQGWMPSQPPSSSDIKHDVNSPARGASRALPLDNEDPGAGRAAALVEHRVRVRLPLDNEDPGAGRERVHIIDTSVKRVEKSPKFRHVPLVWLRFVHVAPS